MQCIRLRVLKQHAQIHYAMTGNLSLHDGVTTRSGLERGGGRHDLPYWTYLPKFCGYERSLWRKRIVHLARAHVDVGQVHLDVDVAELSPLVDSVGDIAEGVLCRHLARPRLDGFVHSVGQR